MKVLKPLKPLNPLEPLNPMNPLKPVEPLKPLKPSKPVAFPTLVFHPSQWVFPPHGHHHRHSVAIWAQVPQAF